MNLVFRHKGCLRQGEEFIHFLTGDVANPLVYVSPDGDEVFLITRADTGALSVEELSPEEWMRIRVTYHLSVVRMEGVMEPTPGVAPDPNARPLAKA